MNKWLLALNGVLVLAVAFLLYNHFKTSAEKSSLTVAENNPVSSNNTLFRIAYFEMDSVEENFTLFKEVQKELNKKQDLKNKALKNLYQKQQSKWEEMQKSAPKMTEEQITAARHELAELENEIRYAEKKWDQEINDYFMTKQQEILSMIRKFFEEYNKDGRFAYILANEPGLFYYKDTACDVTSDLISALNDRYKTAKK